MRRIQIARPDIVRLFDKNPRKVFRRADIDQILSEQRAFWRLALSTTTDQFLEYLQESTKLRHIEIPFPRRKEHRYAWGEVPFFDILMNLNNTSFLSHYGAIRYHGLTEQIPKVLYLNTEQPQVTANSSLTQKGIDYAFRQKPRTSNNFFEVNGYRIYGINGRETEGAGIVEMEVPDIVLDQATKVRITSIERTLIDAAVRPMYAGGVYEVLKAYELGAGRCSVNQLSALLKRIGYTYPYHQAIGFYLEASGGYKASALDVLRKIPQEFDFHLTYQMEETRYVKEWRLYVPKAME